MILSLGLIGVGAFGEFSLRYITPYFKTVIYDRHRDLSELSQTYNVTVGNLADICACDIIVLAVPVHQIEETAQAIKPLLRRGQMVLDVCSVKSEPAKILKETLGDGIDLIGLHPLFGPQSGKNGIHGLNITVCEIRSQKTDCVAQFLATKLGLNVIRTTPENHDREMAYVQGLTHLIGKVIVSLNLPSIQQKTKTYSLLCDMVELIRYDSDDLFRAIQRDNPYVQETKDQFFAAVKDLESHLAASPTTTGNNDLNAPKPAEEPSKKSDPNH